MWVGLEGGVPSQGAGPGAGHGGPQGRAGCLSSKPESPVSESWPDLGCWGQASLFGGPTLPAGGPAGTLWATSARMPAGWGGR